MAYSFFRPIVLVAALALFPGAASSDAIIKDNGNDIFITGTAPTENVTAPRDVLITGSSVALRGSVAQDTHVAGFDVEVEADTGGSVYAAGASVTLRGKTTQDVTAAGFSVRTTPSASVGGNARIAGGTITVEGPINGALTAAGGEIELNAPVTGDVWLTANELRFGENAQIAGKLRYSAPEEIAIPDRVAPADRVTFERLDRTELAREMGRIFEDREYPVMPTFMTIFSSFIVTLAFFIVIGAIFLAFAPNHVERLRRNGVASPGMMLLLGVISLSMLFGLVPVSVMTLVGIPLVPIVLLVIVVMWTLGYILGAYIVVLRLFQAFGNGQAASTLMRLVALAVGVSLAATLNFIPFVGWLVNFTLVLFGLGAISNDIFNRMVGNAGVAMDVDLNPISDEKPE